MCALPMSIDSSLPGQLPFSQVTQCIYWPQHPLVTQPASHSPLSFLGLLWASASCLLPRRECHDLGAIALKVTTSQSRLWWDQPQNHSGLFWGFVTSLLWIVIPGQNSFPISLYTFQIVFFWLQIVASPVPNFILYIFVLTSSAIHYCMFTSSLSVLATACHTVAFQAFPHTDLFNTSSICSLKPAVQEKHHEILLYL